MQRTEKEALNAWQMVDKYLSQMFAKHVYQIKHLFVVYLAFIFYLLNVLSELLQMCMEEIDADKNGSISLKEFKMYCKTFKPWILLEGKFRNRSFYNCQYVHVYTTYRV